MTAQRHESKQRLDNLLVDRGIAENSKRAAAIILSGVVLVDEQRVDKASMLIDSTSEIRIKGAEQQYVSRAGFKLESALKRFALPVQGKVCVDLGASTGGFTDCLLQQGATKVYAFDVGRGQLHWDLQQDARVVVRDSINVRHLTQAIIIVIHGREVIMDERVGVDHLQRSSQRNQFLTVTSHSFSRG